MQKGQQLIDLTNVKASDGMIFTDGETYSLEIYIDLNNEEERNKWYEITLEEYLNLSNKQYEDEEA